MPIYEYECSDCKKIFEKLQGFDDKPLKKCELCGSKNIKKVISGKVGFIFKGPGFYCNDYKDKK